MREKYWKKEFGFYVNAARNEEDTAGLGINIVLKSYYRGKYVDLSSVSGKIDAKINTEHVVCLCDVMLDEWSEIRLFIIIIMNNK